MATNINIRVKFLDPSKPDKQQAAAQFYVVEKKETTSFRDVFLDCCHRNIFPSEVLAVGLQIIDPIYVYGTKDSDTTVVQNTDLILAEVFSFFEKVTCVEFRLNLIEIASVIPTTHVNVDNTKAPFAMFMSPEQRQQLIASERTKQRLCNIERPMYRLEYRNAGDVKENTPNLDRAWDLVCDWLVTHYAFGCDKKVKSKPSHLMYDFIKLLSLLLLQVSPRWPAIWKEMSSYQKTQMRESKILNVIFSDEKFLTLRIVYINDKSPRKNFHQDDCSHLTFALDNLLVENSMSPMFDQLDESLFFGLKELEKVFLTRADNLKKQSTQTAASREVQKSELLQRGVAVLHEHGSLVVVLIGGDSIVGNEVKLVRPCHEPLIAVVASLDYWKYLPLTEFEPDDRNQRYEFFNTYRFFLGDSPFVLLKSTSSDRSHRNIHFYMKIPQFDRLENIQKIQGYKTAFASIIKSLPVIVSRHAKMYIQDCVRETVGGTALHRRILARFLLPRDGSSNCNSREEAIEKVELMIMAGQTDPEFINDLRTLNGSNIQFEPFYKVCDTLFEEAEQHASSSRHGSDIIESNEISSISEFWRMACKRAEGLHQIDEDAIKIPTLNHFQMQFLPPHRCSKTAEKYIGRFKYNLLVQRNCLHADHPDFDHTEANTKYVQHWLCEVKELLSEQQHGVMYIETDDKNKINVCEKGYALSAHQKGASKVLTKRVGVNSSKDKGTADHDAGGSMCKLIPTVYLIPNLDSYSSPSSSLFTGKILVWVHDSILSSSTALRARVNLHKVIEDHGNDPAIVIIKSDGGPEQNFEHMSVCTAIVAGFFHSNLDVLVMMKSCPGNSWTNTIERCMSILNHALVGAVITRPLLTNSTKERDVALEQQFTSCSTQQEIRDKAAKNPDFKESCMVCFEALSQAVQARLVRKASFKGEAIGVVEQATTSEHESFLTSLSRIDQSLPNIVRSSAKGLSDSQIPTLMKPFLCSDHVIKRHYSIQFWKMCWYKKAKNAIDNGEDPDLLQDDACKDCPFGCSRPRTPLSKFALLSIVCSPMKKLSTVDLNDDYLSYAEAMVAIANGSRKDIEQLAKKLSAAQIIVWKELPYNAAGKVMTKSQILAKDRLKGYFRCTKCGKPRGLYTIKVFVVKGKIHVHLEEFLALVGRFNHCGFDLTPSAKEFGIANDFLPYTRLTVGNLPMTCSNKVEEVLYSLDQCQDLCNVCGSGGVILV